MPRTMDRDTRKAQLAEAVWQVILDQGISAVSVRTVAERAGVAVGSLRHVFPTRSALLQFSAELMVQRATDRILSTEPQDDPREFAVALIKHTLPLTPDSRAEFEVNLALLAERTAVPELREVRTHAHQQLTVLSARIVQILTGNTEIPTTDPRAQRLHALIDGLSFHLFHQPPDADPSWALDVMRGEIVTITSSSESF